jgi:NIPSNAP
MIKRIRAAIFAAAVAFGAAIGSEAAAQERVFELRIYTAQPGKFEAMKARFKNHVVPLFEKHGMTVIGFWTASDAPKSADTLTYVLAYPSREAAKKSWDGFRSDPERARVWAETEKDGPINLRVESMYLNPTDFSRIR